MGSGIRKLLHGHFELLTTIQSELWITYILYVLNFKVAIFYWTSPFDAIFFFQGIPETAEVAVPVAQFPANLANSGDNTGTGAVGSGSVSGVPNSSPLNLFPQVLLDHYFECSLLLMLFFCLPDIN